MHISSRRGLFPEIHPFRSGMLAVSDPHRIYFEECGNPHGKPVVMVHGGPGGGSNPTMRRFHDPSTLPHHSVRPARLRALDTARLASG